MRTALARALAAAAVLSTVVACGTRTTYVAPTVVAAGPSTSGN